MTTFPRPLSAEMIASPDRGWRLLTHDGRHVDALLLGTPRSDTVGVVDAINAFSGH
jgi:hypothetical protein